MFWAFASVKQVHKKVFLSCIQCCMLFFYSVLIATEQLFFTEFIFNVIHMVTHTHSEQYETLITQYTFLSLYLQYTQILTTKTKSSFATTGLLLSSYTSRHKQKCSVILFLSFMNISLPLQALLSLCSNIR